MRPLLVPLVLAGCLNKPYERPRYAEILWNPAIDVAFADDGDLLVLSYADGGGLALGKVDVEGRDRAVESAPILLDGAPLDTAFGNGGQNLADWFSLAMHPGTGTPWLYHKGVVGPVVDGAFSPQLDVGTPGEGARGTLAFFDADTLLVSAERIDQSDERTDAVPVDGDTADNALQNAGYKSLTGLWAPCPS